jgi:hypothetical protein
MTHPARSSFVFCSSDFSEFSAAIVFGKSPQFALDKRRTGPLAFDINTSIQTAQFDT